MPAAFLKDVVWRLYFTADTAKVMGDLAWRAISKAPPGLDGDAPAPTWKKEDIKFAWSDFNVIRPLDAAVIESLQPAAGFVSGGTSVVVR